LKDDMMTGLGLVAALLVIAALSWPLPGSPRIDRHLLSRSGRPGLQTGAFGSQRQPASRPSRGLRWAISRAVGWLRRRSPRSLGDGDAADLADLVALGLEAGLSTSAALDLASRSRVHARDPQPEECGPGDVLGLPTEPPIDVPPMLAAALSLSADVGAPVVPSARSAATVLRERARAAERATASAAGPRASMYLLTALPLVGPLALLALGLSLTDVFGSPLTLALVTVGVVLTVAGWIVAREIIRRAERPTRVTRPAPVASS
jgi:tight adherence protein B